MSNKDFNMRAYIDIVNESNEIEEGWASGLAGAAKAVAAGTKKTAIKAKDAYNYHKYTPNDIADMSYLMKKHGLNQADYVDDMFGSSVKLQHHVNGKTIYGPEITGRKLRYDAIDAGVSPKDAKKMEKILNTSASKPSGGWVGGNSTFPDNRIQSRLDLRAKVEMGMRRDFIRKQQIENQKKRQALNNIDAQRGRP
jgi:hypothetical protein